MKIFNSSLSIIIALVIILIVFFIYLFLDGKIRSNYIGFDIFRENYENSSSSTINPYEDYKISELINILIKINSDYQYIMNKLNEMKNNKSITPTTYTNMIVKLNEITISASKIISTNINVNADKFQNIINGTYDPLNVSSSPPPKNEAFTEENDTSRGDLRRNALHPNPSSPNSLQSSTLQPADLSPGGSSSVPPGGSSSVPPGGSSSVPPGGSSSVPPDGSSSVPPSGSSSVPPGGSSPSINYDSDKKTYYIQQLLIPIVQSINVELQKLNDIKKASDDPAKITQMASVM
jgi:hypothetical protein